MTPDEIRAVSISDREKLLDIQFMLLREQSAQVAEQTELLRVYVRQNATLCALLTTAIELAKKVLS